VFFNVTATNHVNSFIGNVDGIDNCQRSGSNYTSLAARMFAGVRLFRFTEHCVKDYETLHVRYSDYNTPASYGFLRYYFSTTTGIYNAVKIGILLLVLFAALVVLIVFCFKKKKPASDCADPTETDEFDDEPAPQNDKTE
jgi:hypothetical protein